MEIDNDKFEAKVWLNINLGTAKGIQVTKDEDLTSCMVLLKNDPYYKGSKFVVEISEIPDQQPEGNAIMEIDNQQLLHRTTYVQEEKLMLISQISEEQEIPIYDMTMENEIVNPVEDQHIESLVTIEGRKRKGKGKAKESPSILLKENASLDDVKLDSVFQEKNAMIRCFCLAAIKEHFEFYVDRSSNTRYSLVCTDKKCGWTVRGSRIKESTLFKVVKFQRSHECSVDIRKSNQGQTTPNVIRDYIIDNLRDIATEVKPRFVISEMKRSHGVDVAYGKAWHAIQKGLSLLRGTTEQNYEFVYMFFIYGASISGWRYYRPLIAVDGTFLKNKYRGVLLVAVTKDANNQIFPIAFGVVDSENNESYEWYFRELRKAIGIRKDLIFLSDRHKAIANGIAKVFPECYHGICIYHLEKNLKQRRVRNTILKLFQSAAGVYLQSEFDDFMSQIAAVDKKTFNYLMEEPPGRWARSHCPRRRYVMLTTIIIESMNNVLRRARELPLLAMMDFIQEKLQSWFYERRTTAEGIFRELSNWAEATLEDKIKPAFTFRVLSIDRLKFNVKEGGMEFIVDLDKRTCDCSEFQLDEIPCEHAIIYQKKSFFCSTYYSRDFWLKTYEGQVNSVGDSTTWVIPDNIKSDITKPLDAKVMLGRRQKNRHVSGTEFKKETRCGRCKKYGHNITNCTNSAVAHPYARKYTKKND
ncbi:PREDICTED: uncharacterized protein LOC109214420 [Nicotiana attenuata]|uniref:uncharacterized protein LOC109214420 n=1 Tax=Nicotiana attenuata TaxID=49451 RepID=UPI000905849C|nr:PREDICTED: uncharacterized protein LOC109214420 [Nicotiana attenuata]